MSVATVTNIRYAWSISRLEKLPISCLRESENRGRSISGLYTIIWREDGEAGWERIVGMITEKEEIAKKNRMRQGRSSGGEA